MKELGVPLKVACSTFETPYSSVRRWRRRQLLGKATVQKPGPRKVAPLALEQLRRDLEGLAHGARRSWNTGALYRRHESKVSRRELGRMIAQSRLEARRELRQRLQKVEWLFPGLAWSMDATEWEHDALGKKLFLHGAQDLCSRYHFEEACVALCSRGEEIAQWLDRLFKARTPPLILKRDNGSPFNHPAVDQTLARYGVIPLNNPPRYPRYNGARERGFGEIKERLADALKPSPIWRVEQTRAAIALAMHDLNHQNRPSLRDRVACAVEFEVGRQRFSRRERETIFASIFNDFRERISRNQRDHYNRPCRTTEWRHAVQAWLRRHDLIKVTLNNNQKVSTY